MEHIEKRNVQKITPLFYHSIYSLNKYFKYINIFSKINIIELKKKSILKEIIFARIRYIMQEIINTTNNAYFIAH